MANQSPNVIRQFAICVKSRMKIVLMTYSWLSIISLCIVFRGFPPPILATKLFCAMTGMALGIYFYNDFSDLEQDIASRKIEGFSPSDRPLSRGLVSKRRMGIFSALLVVSGLTASALINIEVFLIQIAFLVLGLIYSTEPIRLKRIFLMKQVITAIGGAISCLSAGLAAGIINVQLLYLTGLYVLFTAGLNPLGDIRDIDSDRAGGVKTIPLVWGPGFTIRLALATFTAAAATSWIGFYGLGFNIALPIMVNIVCAALAYVVYPLLGRLSDYEYMVNRIYTRVLPLFFILQFAVMLGSFPV